MIILVIRGLFSVWLSRGMERLTQEIEAATGAKPEITDHGEGFCWFCNVNHMIEECLDAHRRGEKIILIGHSFGGTSVLRIARELYRQGVKVDFAGVLDPAGQYDSSIPSNVQKAVSYVNTMPGQLGHGVITPDDTWKKGEFALRCKVTPLYVTHLEIADDPRVHKAMVEGVKETLK